MNGALLGWHQSGLDVWPQLGVTLLMFGATWLAAARLSSVWRRALTWVALFNLLEGSALVLLALGEWAQWPYLLRGPVLMLLAIAGYVAFWYAGGLLSGLPPRPREKLVLLGISAAALLCFAATPAEIQHRVAITYLTITYIAVRGFSQVGLRMARGGDRLTGYGTIVLVSLFSLPMLTRGLGGLLLGAGLDTGSYASRHAVATLTEVAALGGNILVAYRVFGRTLHAVERLAGGDPLSGLHQRSTLEQVLGVEAVHHHRRGRQLAVAGLVIADLPRRRQAWGLPTTEAVMAEVALHLRLRLAPGDALGQSDEGVFLLGLFDTSEAQAAAKLQDMQQAVARDDGLEPEGGAPLALHAAMAMVDPGADLGALVDGVCADCLAADGRPSSAA